MSEKIDAQKLIEKIIQDKNNFSELVNLFEDKLRRYVRRMARISREDEDDFLQEIFIKVYINIYDFDKDLSLNAWVYRIAHNHVIDFYRKDKRQKNHGKWDHEDEIFSWVEDENNFLGEFFKKEESEKIKRTFEKLEKEDYEILYLRFIENYSYKDLSDILKKSEASITSKLHRAKKRFKKIYEGLK